MLFAITLKELAMRKSIPIALKFKNLVGFQLTL